MQSHLGATFFTSSSSSANCWPVIASSRSPNRSIQKELYLVYRLCCNTILRDGGLCPHRTACACSSVTCLAQHLAQILWNPRLIFCAVYVIVTNQCGFVCWGPKKAVLLAELDREEGSKTVLCCDGKRWLVWESRSRDWSERERERESCSEVKWRNSHRLIWCVNQRPEEGELFGEMEDWIEEKGATACGWSHTVLKHQAASRFSSLAGVEGCPMHCASVILVWLSLNIYICLCTLLQESVLSPYWAHEHIFQHLAHLLPINKYHRSLFFLCALVWTTNGIVIFPDLWQVTLSKVKTSCADTLHDHSLLQTFRGLLHTSDCQEKSVGTVARSLILSYGLIFPLAVQSFCVCLFLTALVNHSLLLPIISVCAMSLFFYLLAYFKKIL